MAKERMVVSIDTSRYRLVLEDMRQTFDRLPLNVRLELTPLLERITELNLITMVGMTPLPSPLLMAFADLLDRLADQYD